MSAAPAKRATSFPLPEKALGMHTIALAKTRSGKSSVLRLIVEHGLDQEMPVCIIDPKGDWWGIKSSADGKRPGYPVVIFGGDHADVPINAHAGKQVAELVATGNRPALIDLGGWMPGDRTQFFIDFASTFFRLTRGARWLVIDECHNFAPQMSGGRAVDPQSAKMVHWANRLASEGAGKGVTLFSASQRPQKVHKDYVTSHDTLIALRVIHTLDRKAVRDWMDGADPAKAKAIEADLAQLERGEGFVWSPEAKFGPKRIQFPLFSTFDSFAAPTGQDAPAKLKGWAEVDLDDVRTKLAAVVEEAKANDPKALKAAVEKLKRDLAAAEAKAATPAPSPNAQAAEAIRAKAYAEGAASRDADVASAYRKGFDACAEQMSVAVSTLSAPPPPKPTPPRAPADVQPMARPAPAYVPPPPAPPREPRAPQPAPSGEDWIEAARKLWPATLSWAQLGATIGKKASGGYFYSMRKGLLESGQVREAAGRVVLTSPPDTSGVPAADILSQALPEPSRKMFVALRAQPMAAADLAATLGMKPSGGYWFNGLSILRTAELIEDHGGVLHIAPHLERA